jgi:signal transduction histidine kinase
MMTKILIVDDKEANLFALQRILSRLDVDVVQALTGEAALRETLNHEFALAILDVQMPTMDGYELATLLRSDRTTREIPIIFLSAIYSTEPYVFRGYASGAVDFIAKPFNSEILLSKVRVFLELHEKKSVLAGQKTRLEKVVRHLKKQIKARRHVEQCLLETNERLEQTVNDRTAELAEMVEALKVANAQLATRADQLRALAGKLTMAEHRERGRVSRFLHDGLQQHLAIIKMQLSLISDQLGPEQLRHSAVEIEKLLAESIEMSRSLSAELCPPILLNGRLSDGLKWLASWMQTKHDFSVALEVQDSPQMPEDVKILVFESVRELLFNAVKHANVSKASIGLRLIDANSVRICVSDQGIGFDANALKPAGDACSGFGLVSIGERIDLIGGRLQIDSTPGKGCCFTLTVPLRPARKGLAYSCSTSEQFVTSGDQWPMPA